MRPLFVGTNGALRRPDPRLGPPEQRYSDVAPYAEFAAARVRRRHAAIDFPLLRIENPAAIFSVCSDVAKEKYCETTNFSIVVGTFAFAANGIGILTRLGKNRVDRANKLVAIRCDYDQRASGAQIRVLRIPAPRNVRGFGGKSERRRTSRESNHDGDLSRYASQHCASKSKAGDAGIGNITVPFDRKDPTFANAGQAAASIKRRFRVDPFYVRQPIESRSSGSRQVQ